MSLLLLFGGGGAVITPPTYLRLFRIEGVAQCARRYAGEGVVTLTAPSAGILTMRMAGETVVTLRQESTHECHRTTAG